MDQVKKLYEEMVAYDPSLSKDKESVLQVLEKMLAAKPIVVADPQRKENFGQRLSDYITAKKLSTVQSGRGSRFTKRSFSFASLLTALVVVGASYVRFGTDINPANRQDDNKDKTKNHITYQSTGEGVISETALMDNSVSEMHDSILIAPSAAVSSEVQTDIAFQNTSLALRNTNTIALTTEGTVSSIDPHAKILTQVDTPVSGGGVAGDYGISGVGGGVGGREPSGSYQPEAASTIAMSETADEKDNARISELSQTDADVNLEKKQIALLFMDDDGAVMMSPVIDILRAYRLPAAFVAPSEELALKVRSMGYEVFANTKSVHYTELNTASPYRTISAIEKQDELVVLIPVEGILKNPDALTVFIKEMQSRGYVFVKVSAIQK